MLEGGYGIVPNVVLYDVEVPDAALRLFVIISSHCAERGYCWASNEYLGTLMGKHEKSIPRLLKALDKYVLISGGSNQQRRISLNKNVTPPSQNGYGRGNKNVKHNITSEKYKGKAFRKPVKSSDYLKGYPGMQKRPTVLPPWVIDERKQINDNDTNTTEKRSTK